MSKLEKKKPEELTEFVGIKMTPTMKASLLELARKDSRDFSNYVRLQLEKVIEKSEKGKRNY